MDKEDATANNRENNETNDGVRCAVSDDDGWIGKTNTSVRLVVRYFR